MNKPLEQFGKRLKASTVYSSYCKPCDNARTLAIYKANRLKALTHYSNDTDEYIRQLQQEIVRLKKRISKLEEQTTDDGK